MRDWEQYVRQHLDLPDFARPREARIVAELASQFEDFHREAIARGLNDDEADAHARAQITDWVALGEMLRDVDRPHVRSRLDRWGDDFADRARQPSRRMGALADLWQDLRYARRLASLRGGALDPDTVELEFGVKLNAAAGAVIAKTSVEGHLKVKMTWGQPARTAEEA